MQNRVAQFASFGGPEVLEIGQMPLREPLADEVVVRVRAVGLNPVDYKIRRGERFPDLALPFVGGRELAGTVEQIGPEVSQLKVGDEVFGSIPDGALADAVVISSRYFALRPPTVSPEVAGGLALAGQTAWDALAAVELSAGDSLFVSAAAGGVGSILVQLAVSRGIQVTGSASLRNHDWLRERGVTPVEYGDGLLERLRANSPDAFTAAIDLQGNDSIRALLDLGQPASRINSIATEPTTFVTMRAGRGPTNIDTLDALAALVANGQVVIPIEAVYPLIEVADAFRQLEGGHLRGKIVVVP